MATLIFLLIFFALVIVICAFLVEETNGQSIIGILVCGFICWCMIEGITTDIDDPVAIPMTELSIMVDDEVAIIRYDGKNYTYDNVTEYNSIKDSTFTFMEIKEYDVLGEHNDSTFELITN